MFKKLLLAGVLCVSLMAILENEAKAWGNYGYSGWSGLATGGSYIGTDYLRGGSPDKANWEVRARYLPRIAYLELYTSGSNRTVIEGIGGSVGGVEVNALPVDVEIDENGNVVLNHHLAAAVWECDDVDADGPIYPGCNDKIAYYQAEYDYPYDLAREYAWMEYWGIDWSWVKNNWHVGALKNLEVKIISGIYDLDVSDTEPDEEIITNCLTTRDWRDIWFCEDCDPPPETFKYICLPDGAPFTIDDEIPVQWKKGITLAPPGVLENDKDYEHDTLTAHLVDDVTNGTLDLHADGSLTYTPNSKGVDFFTYYASDGVNDGNVGMAVFINK